MDSTFVFFSFLHTPAVAHKPHPDHTCDKPTLNEIIKERSAAQDSHVNDVQPRRECR
jgi:hypothetical protein